MNTIELIDELNNIREILKSEDLIWHVKEDVIDIAINCVRTIVGLNLELSRYNSQYMINVGDLKKLLQDLYSGEVII